MDKRLRRAMAQLIDVPTVVRQALGRLAVPANGFIPPGLLGHDSTISPRLSLGGVAAAELPSTEIELTAVLNPVFWGEYSALFREISNILSEHKIGIRVVNSTMEEWIESVAEGTVDLVFGRWAADYPDADTFAVVLASKEGLLGQMCGSAEVDRVVDRGRLETSPAARHAVYRQMEELIARDTLLLPLFHEQTYRFARPEVEGLTLSSGIATVDYENLSLRPTVATASSTYFSR
jgi:ABC-type oligopeptide transport system substrate-binding subunit